jgi:hypothetical protein
MSCSSLYGIKKDYTGEELYEYKNSWLFSPIVWNVLSDKYLPRQYGMVQSVIGLNGNEVWSKINNIMNNSDNTSDRICWEMSNQQIFFTKDKECIINNIHKFIEQNKEYYKSEEDNISALEREHIIERFNEIANDILSLDENEYPYFVFKNTSVDDAVERWFYTYDENEEYIDKSLKDWEEYIAEFVVITDDRIANFVSNLDYKYT